MRELNRLGVTGAIDAGGGFQNYPEDYAVIVPDRDYFSCPEAEIADILSDLTMVGGKVVYAAGDFASLDQGKLPPAMPDWSPVRAYGGYGAWGDAQHAHPHAAERAAVSPCGCASTCGIHGHNHAHAWTSSVPAADLKSFWGALGCSCWAV